MKLTLFVVVPLYLTTMLNTIATDNLSVMPLVSSGSNEPIGGVQFQTLVPSKPISLGDRIPLHFELEYDKSEKVVLPETITVELTRKDWTFRTTAPVSWTVPSARRSGESYRYLSALDLYSVIDLPGNYRVVCLPDGSDFPKFSSIAAGHFEVAGTPGANSDADLLLPNDLESLPKVVASSKSEEDSPINVMIEIERGKTAGDQPLVAEVTFSMEHQDSEKISLRPYITVELVRKNWTKVSNIPLYNVPEISIRREEPFTYRMDLRERLDIVTPGSYQIRFGHVSETSVGDHYVGSCLTEQCHISVIATK